MKKTLSVLMGVLFTFAVLGSCENKQTTVKVEDEVSDTIKVVDTLLVEVDTVSVPLDSSVVK